MLVGLATILIFALIIILTIRLRKAEMNTLYTIGAARLKIFQMILGEISVLLITSVLLAFTLYLATGFFVESFINKFIL